jgi:hypothetical protein
MAYDTLGFMGRLPAEGYFDGPSVYIPDGSNPDAKVAVHVRTHNAKAGCDYGVIESCSDIVTTIPDMSVDAFPVFFDLTEYTRVEFGLAWPDSWSSALWTACSDLSSRGIEHPGEGAISIWETCRTGAAVPGYAWLYACTPGLVCVCPHPETGKIWVVDCSSAVNEPILNFCAGVYGAEGDCPCWWGAEEGEGTAPAQE